jgi:prepilin-type N-terminal cleavage/methylation domain-containing protein
MHESIRERRSEGGFTLIELLVVMIIIAILMAVAIPTFLAQKNTAQKTKVTANIKQIVNAIESCAANNTDGTYTGCTTLGASVTDPNTLKQFEKGLANLTQGTALNQYSVAAVGTQGYRVAGSIQDGNVSVWFAEIHQEDGTILKICGPGTTAAGMSATTPQPVANSRTCAPGGANAGKWG